MKNKKIVVYILLGLFTASLLCSCAIDKKCPAYTKAETENINPTV